jgi:hypothetical protein
MKKRYYSVLLAAAAALMLASCDEDIINYPTDASSQIVTVTNDPNGEVTDNEMGDIYKNVATDSARAAQTLDNLLYNWAQDSLTGDYALSDTEFQKRYQKQMMDTVKAGTYSTDSVFDEYRYALSLVSQMYVVTDASGNSDLASLKAAATKKVITPDMTFDEIFSLKYQDYIDRYFKPTIYRRYLVDKYIYDKMYSSIGTSQARNITSVKLTDRSDKPGEVLKLINAWIKKYLSYDVTYNVHTYATANGMTDAEAQADLVEKTDLHNLARLWKGVDVTTEEKAWLKANNISTLADKIDEEAAKIKLNAYTTDSSLEATYTGSYAYPVEHGVELAKHALEAQDLITEGTYLKSSSLTNVPSDLKDRIFSSLSTNEDGIYNAGENDPKDDSCIVRHTYVDESGAELGSLQTRYITPKVTIAASTTSTTDKYADLANQIVTYDSSTSSYYLCQVNTIVDSTRLNKLSTDDDKAKAAKRELAVDAAYEMATNDTYKKDSTVYYLTHHKLSISDPDFYDYIKSNYADALNSDGWPIYTTED